MIWLRFEAESQYPITHYRIDDLQGNIIADWQESNIFKAVPPGGGYVLMARNTRGSIGYKTIPEEEPLQILSDGAYLLLGGIVATWSTNIPAQVGMDYAITSDPVDPEEDQYQSLDYSGSFKTEHLVTFPESFLGSFHWFRARARSNYGQYVTGEYRGIYIVPDEVLIEPERLITTTELHSVENLKFLYYPNLNNIFSSVKKDNYYYELEMFATTSVNKVTPSYFEESNKNITTVVQINI